jgi:multidrug efflux pump subunit AcrA (membrane-fusion protein)
MPALLLLALGVGVGWTGARSIRAAPAGGPAGAWETALVARRDLGATVLATGVVRPKVGAQVVVGSRASGVVERLHVTVGDRVQAGDLLAELDPTEFTTQVERATAALENAQAERAYAERELRRTELLLEGGASADIELAQARRSFETARAREREAGAVLHAGWRSRDPLDHAALGARAAE